MKKSILMYEEVFIVKEVTSCLKCAGLEKLVYLPSGDAALSRRARKNSEISAIVYRYNKSKRRPERQGILVEPAALKKAEEQCRADAGKRAKRRKKDQERRMFQEMEYTQRFEQRIRELFPGCPDGVESEIAEHACEVSSGRVGRCSAAKDLDDEMIHRAVVAHIRHKETYYDDLFTEYGFDKQSAREEVADLVNEVVNKWKNDPDKAG